MNEFRELKVKNGGEEIFRGCRIKVGGRANMTLIPDFFLACVYNPEESDIARIEVDKRLVICTKNDAILCSGEIDDVYIKEEGANRVFQLSLVDGQSFWTTKILKSVGAGASFSTTIAHILENALMGSYLAPEKRFFRGQSFNGRLADFVSDIAAGVHARAFISNNVLHVVTKGRSEIIVNILDEDVLATPSYANGVCLLKTTIKGWPVGMLHEFRGKKYRLAAQSIDADNFEGNWQTELVLVDEDYLSTDGMDGGG